jgi:hypothetical protein
MALEAPRPLLGAGYYIKKFVAYLNNIHRKKLFYIQTLTKLPELTVLTSILLNYVLWQCRIKRLLPSTVTVLFDIDFMFDNICTISSRIRVLALTNNSLLCRRWRTNGHGRG